MLLTHMIQNTNEHDPSADVERSCLCCTCINQVIHYLSPESFDEKETNGSDDSKEVVELHQSNSTTELIIIPDPPKRVKEEPYRHAEISNEISGPISTNDSSLTGSDSDQSLRPTPNPIIIEPIPEPPIPDPPIPEPAAEENFCQCTIRNHQMDRFAQVRISHLVTGVKIYLKSKYFVVQCDLDKSVSNKLTPQDAMKKIEKYVNAKQSGKSDSQIRPCITRIEFP